MMDDDEKSAGLGPKRRVSHEIGQPLDSLSAAEIGERISLLNDEIERLEKARRFKQDGRAAAAAIFKI